jgi:hypothetical protein
MMEVSRQAALVREKRLGENLRQQEAGGKEVGGSGSRVRWSLAAEVSALPLGFPDWHPE